MPIFDYQCNDCGKQYDVFHKNREIKDDVFCPFCGSKKNKRLISVPNITMSSSSNKSYKSAPSDNCDSCCNSDVCGLN